MTQRADGLGLELHNLRSLRSMGHTFAWCCGDQWRWCTNEGITAGSGLSIWSHTGGLDVSEQITRASAMLWLTVLMLFDPSHFECVRVCKDA